MTAAKLLSDLEQRDVAVTVEGGQLRVDAPRGVLTEDLRRTLSEHKPEIVALIRDRTPAPGSGASEQPGEDARIAAMTLDDFAEAGLVVRIRSRILGALVLFVSDDVPDTALAALESPIYRVAELRKLAILRSGPRALRCIHDVKTIFDGVITDVRSSDDH